MGNEKIMPQGIFWVRVCSLIVVVLVAVLVLSSCAQQKSEEPESSNSEYTQTVIDFPERVDMIRALEKTSSGKLWTLGVIYEPESITSPMSVWQLNDDNSWKELTNINDLLSLNESDFIYASTLTKDNRVLCCVLDAEDYPSGMQFYLVDPVLESYQNLSIDTSEFIKENTEESLLTSIYKLYPLDNNQILIQNSFNSLLVLDITNEVIKRIPVGMDKVWAVFLGAVEIDDVIYILYENRADGGFTELRTQLCTLDVSTGSFKDIDNEELISLFNEYGVKEPRRIIPTMKADSTSTERLTFCLRGGLIAFSNGEARVIANAEDTIMADTSMDIWEHAFINEDNFFLLGFKVNDLDHLALYKYEKTAGL